MYFKMCFMEYPFSNFFFSARRNINGVHTQECVRHGTNEVQPSSYVKVYLYITFPVGLSTEAMNMIIWTKTTRTFITSVLCARDVLLFVSRLEVLSLWKMIQNSPRSSTLCMYHVDLATDSCGWR